MKIKIYKAEVNLPAALLGFLDRTYGTHKNYDLFLNDFKKAFAYCVESSNIKFIPFIIEKDKEMLGHISLILDQRLGPATAFFGFFELVNDKAVFDLLWTELCSEAKKKGIKMLLGPVNGSIWHQYRNISKSDTSEYFNSEPMSQKHYFAFLKGSNAIKEIEYHSAYRENFAAVMSKIKTSESILKDSGFTIEQEEKMDLGKLIKIAHLSKTVFSKSWGFTELTKEEFLKLYPSDKIEENLNKLYILYKREEIIGYCSTIIEDKDTLICKTICILPEYQGLGLGNALAFRVHKDAISDGYSKIIYALVRTDNKIKNFPQNDVVIFRNYSTFEFKI